MTRRAKRVPLAVVTVAAMVALAYLGARWWERAYVEWLISGLGQSSADTRSQAARRLGEVGAAAARAVPALIQRFNDSDGKVREAAALALADIGEPAVAPLIACLRHGDESIGLQAAWALTNMGPSAAPAVPALVGCLGDENARVRHAAALTLADIGPAAREAVPALRERVRAEPPEGTPCVIAGQTRTMRVRAAAQEALAKIEGAQAVEGQ